MFGYVRCFKDELKLKHVKIYHNYYCGVCTRIRCHWGMPFLATLSYDAAFLSIFLDNYRNDRKPYWVRCPFMPVGRKKEMQCSLSVLDYAALINGYLTVKKMEDNFRDDGNWFWGAAAACLKRTKGYRNFQSRYPQLFQHLETSYLQYMNAENDRACNSVDEYSILFGDFLGEVYCGIAEYDKAYYYDDKMKQDLREFGKIIGMWIYIMDALDDYDSDVKTEKFNPLTFMEGKDAFLLEKTTKMLMLMEADLLVKFREMGCGVNGDIIENTLTYGMRAVMNKVVKDWRQGEMTNG